MARTRESVALLNGLAARDWIWSAAAGLVVAWIAFTIVGGVFRASVRSAGPASYGEIAGRSPADWEMQIRSAEDAAALETVETAARTLLTQAPLESGAIWLLGLVAEAQGDIERADGLMRLAEARSRADVKVQGWLFRRGLATDDLDGALAHLDAILRVDPALREAFVPVIVALAQTPDGALSLAKALSRDPPWRGPVLRDVTLRSPDPLAPLATFAALRPSAHPPSAVELNLYLDRLVQEGAFDLAYRLWTEFQPAAGASPSVGLYNGSFEITPTGAPFDWRLDPIRGARVGIAREPGSLGGRALRVEFLNTRVPFRNVRQLLRLPAGAWELRGQVKADALLTERGLRWIVSCAEGARQMLAASEPVRETRPWGPFSVAFEVPGRDCAAQWLTLELAARIRSEQQAVGRAWFDALGVEALAAPHPRPAN